MRLLAVAMLLAFVVAGCAGPGPGGSSTTKPGTTTPQDTCRTPSSCPTPTTDPSTTTGPGSTTDPGTSTTPPTPGNQTGGEPRAWVEPGSASIRPGVQAVSDNRQCTTNFLFTSPDNLTVYIGLAAHCVNESADSLGTATSGCQNVNSPIPLGSEVEIEGADAPGILAYSSWLTMQANGESDATICDLNDFALIQLSAADAANANPAMLGYGGPTEVAVTDDVHPNEKVLTFGNSGLRMGFQPIKPKEGYVVSVTEWWTRIYTVTPGVQGDSGSAVILGDGRALGILVTSEYAPFAGANGVTNLEPALAYAKEKAGMDVRLATWGMLDDGNLPPL